MTRRSVVRTLAEGSDDANHLVMLASLPAGGWPEAAGGWWAIGLQNVIKPDEGSIRSGCPADSVRPTGLST
jgi:hypothetical protein